MKSNLEWKGAPMHAVWWEDFFDFGLKIRLLTACFRVLREAVVHGLFYKVTDA